MPVIPLTAASDGPASQQDRPGTCDVPAPGPQPVELRAAGTDGRSHGVIRLGETAMAVPIAHLSEVCRIGALSALPMKSNLLLGGFELRGSIVPVLDLDRICGAPPRKAASGLGVVLQYKGRILAFHIDEVLGIAQPKAEQIQSVTETQPQGRRCFEGVFSDHGRFCSVLDVEAVFGLPGVYSASKSDHAANRQSRQNREPMLSFLAGGTRFAVPAIEVYAAVPRQPIQVTAITSGHCLGEIRYHDFRIPVVRPSDVVGLGVPQHLDAPEIVVLVFPDGNLLGFAVDSISDIDVFRSERSAALPFWNGPEGLIAAVQIQPDGEQIFCIDVDRLRRTPDVSTIASLTMPTGRTEEPTGRVVQASNIEFERERYLVVKAGKTFAIPLTQVNSIIAPPVSVTRTNLPTPGLRGYFSQMGQSVALIDLADILGTGGQTGQPSRVLLTGAAGQQIGFLIEAVVSIEMSHWREKPGSSPAGQGASLVQLGPKSSKFALPCIDLTKVIADSTGMPAAPV